MKIIAIDTEKSGTTAEDFAPYLEDEAQRVYELQQADIVREIYFKQDGSGAVLILECESVDAAREALDSLPLVLAGLISFELIPLKPYPGLERLFR